MGMALHSAVILKETGIGARLATAIPGPSITT